MIDVSAIDFSEFSKMLNSRFVVSSRSITVVFEVAKVFDLSINRYSGHPGIPFLSTGNPLEAGRYSIFMFSGVVLVLNVCCGPEIASLIIETVAIAMVHSPSFCHRQNLIMHLDLNFFVQISRTHSKVSNSISSSFAGLVMPLKFRKPVVILIVNQSGLSLCKWYRFHECSNVCIISFWSRSQSNFVDQKPLLSPTPTGNDPLITARWNYIPPRIYRRTHPSQGSKKEHFHNHTESQ